MDALLHRDHLSVTYSSMLSWCYSKNKWYYCPNGLLSATGSKWTNHSVISSCGLSVECSCLFFFLCKKNLAVVVVSNRSDWIWVFPVLSDLWYTALLDQYKPSYQSFPSCLVYSSITNGLVMSFLKNTISWHIFRRLCHESTNATF